MVTYSDLGLGHTNDTRHSYQDDIPFIMALFSKLAFFCLFMVSILQLECIHGDGLACIMQIALYFVGEYSCVTVIHHPIMMKIRTELKMIAFAQCGLYAWQPGLCCPQVSGKQFLRQEVIIKKISVVHRFQGNSFETGSYHQKNLTRYFAFDNQKRLVTNISVLF